jgi:hypothetical protein
MATSTISIPPKTWILISTVSVKFQVQGQSSIYIIEAASLPAEGDLSIRKTANPGKMYTFEKVDGNFYAYSDNSTAISIEPVT